MVRSIYTIALLVCIAASPLAKANLIENGGFEDNDVSQNTWRWYTSDNVNGWSGSTVEIWDTFLGVTAVDGSQFAELNAHGNNGQQFSIFQTFDTRVNGLYNLSFYYQARRNTNEKFEVALNSNGNSLFSQIMDDHVRNSWSFFSTQFRAVSTMTTLSFTSITPYSGTVGNFIDSVSVTSSIRPQASVSEPATLMVSLLGIFGLAITHYTRRRKHLS